MEKKIQKITVLFFACWIGFFFLAFLGIKPKAFSEIENRYLAQQPQFSYDRFLSGKYTSQLEDYIIDQFPWRTMWVQLKSALSYGSGQLENNGIYLGKEETLIPQVLLVDKEAFQSNIEKMKQFQHQNPSLEFSWIIVPPVSTVAQSLLPDFAVNVDQKEWLNEIQPTIDGWVDLSELNHPQQFYKTDHHWNEQGAYAAYESFAQHKNLSPQEFEWSAVGFNFKGTSSSSAAVMWTEGDTIYKIEPKDKIVSSVTYEDGTKWTSLYHPERLKEKDQYTYYLDGNHSFVQIQNQGVLQDQGTLLILKDSYAHVFIPYLASHYSEIIVVDLRYYNSSVSSLLESVEVDEVLYLYGVDTLMSEKNFVFLK